MRMSKSRGGEVMGHMDGEGALSILKTLARVPRWIDENVTQNSETSVMSQSIPTGYIPPGQPWGKFF